MAVLRLGKEAELSILNEEVRVLRVSLQKKISLLRRMKLGRRSVGASHDKRYANPFDSDAGNTSSESFLSSGALGSIYGDVADDFCKEVRTRTCMCVVTYLCST